jgi:RHS repeat-associated protein
MNQSFSYDDASNLSIGSAPWTFNANNQLTQSTTSSGSTINQDYYDADGNYIGPSSLPSLETRYSYNNDNRRSGYSISRTNSSTTSNGDTSSTLTTSTKVNYHYDPMGRRIGKSVSTGSTTPITTWYLWEGQNLLAEYNASGQRQKRYAYLPGSYLPEQMADSTGTYTVHSDHLQTPTVLSNSQGTTVWSMQHVAYGQAWINRDPDVDGIAVEFNLRFPWQYYEQETGLNYNYFRDYDPAIGRYIQSDPIGLAGGMNVYGYVENNPLVYFDFYGLAAATCENSDDKEKGIQKCLNSRYGSLYTVASYASPFSALGALGVISGEILSSGANAAKTASYVHAWGGAISGRNAATASRLLRTGVQASAIGAASTISTVVGVGAAGFMAGAYGYCNFECSRED